MNRGLEFRALSRVCRPHALCNLRALLALDDADVILALQVEPELRSLPKPLGWVESFAKPIIFKAIDEYRFRGEASTPRPFAPPILHAKMVTELLEAQDAMTRTKVELVREGKYAAEVSIELIEEEGGWSPYLSLDDARKLEAARLALREATFSKQRSMAVYSN